MKINTLLKNILFVKKDSKSQCYNWTSFVRRDGYGVIWIKNKNIPVHRFFYELLVDTIPKGFVLDHLCRNRKCVNPDHMEVVTDKINILRGVGITAINSKKTHCIRGHPFSGDNLKLFPNGWRGCKICIRYNVGKANKKYYAKKKILGM